MELSTGCVTVGAGVALVVSGTSCKAGVIYSPGLDGGLALHRAASRFRKLRLARMYLEAALHLRLGPLAPFRQTRTAHSAAHPGSGTLSSPDNLAQLTPVPWSSILVGRQFHGPRCPARPASIRGISHVAQARGSGIWLYGAPCVLLHESGGEDTAMSMRGSGASPEALSRTPVAWLTAYHGSVSQLASFIVASLVTLLFFLPALDTPGQRTRQSMHLYCLKAVAVLCRRGSSTDKGDVIQRRKQGA